ncbi:hypothetical protein MF672_031870 [Actinomadura sp. ATCC 31491]|uniref:Secreted protein n=1 Tax=Actinomadura luzonensis TaxID=2805427 RepID=A0ABT0G169_9ACTN|nr:hypothetical protein [Actinomadura luzonensis]MCK2218357.1 hypothetical protein [Actinomadura luzonensis]
MRRLPLILTAGALAAGTLLAPAAQAATTATAAAAAQQASQARWFTIWDGGGNTRGIDTGAIRNRAKVLQIVTQCWNGGDGTAATATLYKWGSSTFGKGGGWMKMKRDRGYCLGGKMYTRVSNAKAGEKWRATVKLGPKSHTVRVWVQNYG